MPTVNTVLGPAEPAALGFTLSHEHVGTNAAGLRHTYPEFLDRTGLLEQAVAAMRAAYQAGVRTMVEVTTFDLGRDIDLIQEVSRRSGVQEARRRATPTAMRSSPGGCCPVSRSRAPQTATSTSSRWRTRVGSLKGAELPAGRGPQSATPPDCTGTT